MPCGTEVLCCLGLADRRLSSSGRKGSAGGWGGVAAVEASAAETATVTASAAAAAAAVPRNAGKLGRGLRVTEPGQGHPVKALGHSVTAHRHGARSRRTVTATVTAHGHGDCHGARSRRTVTAVC